MLRTPLCVSDVSTKATRDKGLRVRRDKSKGMKHIVSAVLIAVLPTSVLFAQSQQRAAPSGRGAATALTAGCEPSLGTLKRIASRTWAASHDPVDVLAAVDAAVGTGASDPFEFVGHADGLAFAVVFPPRYYRWKLSEALRKREPIESATVSTSILIQVSVTQIDAPNIEKVIVERDGRVVPSLSGALSPHVGVTRLGAKSVHNEGTFTYPCSAFFPGASVVVT